MGASVGRQGKAMDGSRVLAEQVCKQAARQSNLQLPWVFISIMPNCIQSPDLTMQNQCLTCLICAPSLLPPLRDRHTTGRSMQSTSAWQPAWGRRPTPRSLCQGTAQRQPQPACSRPLGVLQQGRRAAQPSPRLLLL